MGNLLAGIAPPPNSNPTCHPITASQTSSTKHSLPLGDSTLQGWIRPRRLIR